MIDSVHGKWTQNYNVREFASKVKPTKYKPAVKSMKYQKVIKLK